MALYQKILVPIASMTVISLLVIYHAIGAGTAHSVKYVYDGCTILLDDHRKVRLIGVEAPEVQSPFHDEEPFGPESRAYLTNLVLNKRVKLTLGDPSVDVYGRTLAYVSLGDVLVNGRIIRDGWARAHRRFFHPWRDLFFIYEREARSRGRGMWKDRAKGDQ